MPNAVYLCFSGSKDKHLNYCQYILAEDSWSKGLCMSAKSCIFES